MPTLLGPFSVGFPVAFHSGGDTTRDAFGKHIEEIKRIYGYLNALDNGKVSADDINGQLSGFSTQLQNHINSTNPHPNWRPSLSFSDITGNLAGSRITGTLTNAYIDATHVNNLKSFINNNVTIPDKGDGITEKNITGNGYVKFANGLIIQWGTHYNNFDGEGTASVTFPTKFSNTCLSVTATVLFNTESIGSNCNVFAQLIQPKITASGFTYNFQAAENIPGSSYVGKMGIKYIAIGN